MGYMIGIHTVLPSKILLSLSLQWVQKRLNSVYWMYNHRFRLRSVYFDPYALVICMALGKGMFGNGVDHDPLFVGSIKNLIKGQCSIQVLTSRSFFKINDFSDSKDMCRLFYRRHW